MYKFVAVLFAMLMVNVFAQEYIINGKVATREDLLAMIKDGSISKISIDTLVNRGTGSETLLTQQNTTPVEKKTITTITETVSRPVEHPLVNKIFVENKPAANQITPNFVAARFDDESITVPPQVEGTGTILAAPAPVQQSTTTTTTNEILNRPAENKNIIGTYTGFLNPIVTPDVTAIQTPVVADVVPPRFNGNLKDDAFSSTINKDTILTETSGRPSNGFLIDQLNPVQPIVQTTKIFTTPENWHQTTEEELKQARNAKYQWNTVMEDGISGNYQQRSEARQNGVVTGSYSYDDGFAFRTTYYEADINGFRITKQEVLPSRMKSLTGQAHVQTFMDGRSMEYRIGEKDINGFSRRAKLIQ